MAAPIVIFAFNRPGALARLKASLERNAGYAEAEKYVFVDGPRTEADRPKVAETVRIAKEMTAHVTLADVNKGLGRSVIEGVTAVISRYGRAIVLEDDLYCMPNFLAYMNQALDAYAADARIFSVCGYGLKIKRPARYVGDVYLSGRSSSWGWGTWADRWAQVDWAVSDWPQLASDRRRQRAFNRNGSDMFGMLRDCMNGRNHSWAIRFCYAQFRLGKYAVCPFLSKVENVGFGADATNCRQRYSRFKAEPDRTGRTTFDLPANLQPDARVAARLYRYHSIPMRIYSKLRNLLHL